MSLGDIGPEKLRALLGAQTRIASAELEPRDVMAVAMAEAQSLTGATGAAVELLEGDDLVSSAATGSLHRELRERSPRAGTFSGLCLDAGEVVWSEDPSGDPRVPSGAGESRREGSLICAPLHHAGSAIGVIKLAKEGQPALSGEGAAVAQVLSAVIGSVLGHALRYAQRAEEERRDPLTGLGNRAALDERVVMELARARRHQEPLSLALLDIDGFGAISESHGRPAADRVLRAVASLLLKGRASDAYFRTGADEFAILMPNTPRGGAEVAAIRLAWSIATGGEELLGATVSSGVAQSGTGDDPSAFVAAAEVALREAKQVTS